MKTPEQLKGAIRNIAASNNLRAQEVLQMYMFERIIERLAKSKYRNNFILKGGLLISSMIGISSRTTMDMDTTVKGIQMEEDEIVEVIKEIIAVDVGDNIEFEYLRIEPIREDDAYNNFRVHLNVKYGKINSPIKIDITTGDVITPSEIKYDFPMLFEDKSVTIMAYTLETVLAEKYETIIRRNISSTRARDFYDLYALYKLRKHDIRIEVFRKAVLHTAEKRGSLLDIKEWEEIIAEMRDEKSLQLLWENYIEQNPYVEDLDFITVMDVLYEVAEMLNIK